MISKQDILTAVKYIGDKIDNLAVSSKKVELDLTSRAIEKLQDIDMREINAVVSAMKEVAKGQSDSNKELIAALNSFEKATKDDSKVSDILVTSRNVQRQMLTVLEKMKTELKPEKSDGKELAAIKAVEAAVKANKPEKFTFDMRPIEGLRKVMERMESSQSKMDKEHKAYMKALTEAVRDLPKQIKLSVPKEFKLEENQLRSIRSAGGGAIGMASLDAPNGGLYAGRKVVTTAGTAVALSDTSTKCENIVITAESDNTGYIAVGDSNVVAAEGSQAGVILTPLGSVKVKVGDLAKIYIDSTVNGEGVSFAYEL